MKYATSRPYADPERAARKLLEIATEVEAAQDVRIHIEKLNGPFLYREKGSPAEYGAGLAYAIEKRLTVAERIPNLCEVHSGRRGSFA